MMDKTRPAFYKKKDYFYFPNPTNYVNRATKQGFSSNILKLQGIYYKGIAHDIKFHHITFDWL